MSELCVDGGIPLRGSVRIQGSKNAALPFMAAALLCKEEILLKECPQIADVFCMETILKYLGAETKWEKKQLLLKARNLDGYVISPEHAGCMRSSVLLLGPLLARGGKVVLGTPGGCTIGKRPINLHLNLLRKMGAVIQENNNWICAYAGKLKGTHIVFSSRSVGATEQGILSAVCAEGETTLYPCAREPEIVWLCSFLRKMGADIEGEGSDKIYIKGKKELHGAEIEVPPDRIVAGTYLCACAATRGKIILENAPVGELQAFLELYKKMGGQLKQKSGTLLADSGKVAFPVPFMETEVYPGFPTDLQSPMIAVLATINGESRIRENIFENRFQAADEMRKMGAEIFIKENEALVRGGKRLTGCRIKARELRGGAALLVSALAAQGRTTIEGYSYIKRGYENIIRDITALGGRIRENTGTEIYGERNILY